MGVVVDRWSLYRGVLVPLKCPMEQPAVVTVDRWSLYRGVLVPLKCPMEQPAVVTVDRWSLYRGVLVPLKCPMEQPAVVTVDRWSLYRGVLVPLKCPMEQPAVVTVDRWSLRHISLYFTCLTTSSSGYSEIGSGRSEKRQSFLQITQIETPNFSPYSPKHWNLLKRKTSLQRTKGAVLKCPLFRDSTVHCKWSCL